MCILAYPGYSYLHIVFNQAPAREHEQVLSQIQGPQAPGSRQDFFARSVQEPQARLFYNEIDRASKGLYSGFRIFALSSLEIEIYAFKKLLSEIFKNFKYSCVRKGLINIVNRLYFSNYYIYLSNLEFHIIVILSF